MAGATIVTSNESAPPPPGQGDADGASDCATDAHVDNATDAPGMAHDDDNEPEPQVAGSGGGGGSANHAEDIGRPPLTSDAWNSDAASAQDSTVVGWLRSDAMVAPLADTILWVSTAVAAALAASSVRHQPSVTSAAVGGPPVAGPGPLAAGPLVLPVWMEKYSAIVRSQTRARSTTG